MSVNGNVAKLTTLSKSAVKALGATPMVWYAVQVDSNFIFGIDKKVNDPNKFKKPLKVKSYLEKMKVGDVSNITKDCGVISGLVVKNGDNIQIAVVCKTNGAGKSTLKSLMKDSTIRKLLKNPELVKSIGTERQDDAEDAIEQQATDALEAANIEISKELKDAIKYFLWWNDSARATYTSGIAAPTSSNEDDLQKIYRRLKKFAEKKMYKLFEVNRSIFGDTEGPLHQFKPSDFDLTKTHLKEYLGKLKEALNAITDAEDQRDIDQEASLEADEELAAMEDDHESVSEWLGLKGSDAAAFIAAANSNKATWKILWKDFAKDPDGLVSLKNRLANGTWEDFFRIATAFENA